MKSLFIIVVIIFLLQSQLLNSQPCEIPATPIMISPRGTGYSDFELAIYNQTYWYAHEDADTLMVKLIPIGAFYNANFKYSAKAEFQIGAPQRRTFISGTTIYVPPQIDSNTFSKANGNFDIGGSCGTCSFAYGFGKYKLEFYRKEYVDTLFKYVWVFSNYVNIDFRNSDTSGVYPLKYSGNNDIRIDYFSKDLITFHFHPHENNYPTYDSTYWNINSINKNIIMWELFGTCLTPMNQVIGVFTPDTSDNGQYLKWPINAKKYNENVGQENPGDLGMNVEIDHNITTQDTAISDPTNIIISPHRFLKILPGKTFDMKTSVGGMNNLIVEDTADLVIGGTLIVGNHNMLSLRSKGTIRVNNKLIFQKQSTFCNEGGLVTGRGGITFEKGYNNYYHNLCNQTADYYIKDSVKFVLEDSVIFEVPDSITLNFTGNQTALIMKPHSKLKMGAGSKIFIGSNAKLIADSAEFSSLDSTKTWEGIVFENSSHDTIKNCTFKNAKTALSFVNTEGASYNRRIIQNNVFNVPSGGDHKGIYGENNFRILIKDNTFNMPVSPGSNNITGIYLKNISFGTYVPRTEIPEPLYTMNIVHNTFNNGSASIILANYISSISSYYIAYNTFNNAASVNLIGMKINGRIVKNIFTSTTVPIAVHLISSYPDMYKNNILARDAGLHLSGHCYPNLAPYASGNTSVWSGGSNILNSEELDNIQLSSSGYAKTDFGNNNFNLENESAYHVYGWIDSSYTIYKSRENCWNGSVLPRIYLKEFASADTIPEPYITISSYDCTTDRSATGWNVSYIGSEMYDSIKVTTNNTGGQPTGADMLWSQGIGEEDLSNFSDAIVTYKYLFDNYPEYEYTPEILNSLFNCYQGLDTSVSEVYRESLYQDLIDYIDAKVESDYYFDNIEFLDNAAYIRTDAQSYIDAPAAANAYELIALSHPDPNIRLIASWDYEEIQDLIEAGEGGGRKQLGIKNYELGITNYALGIEEMLNSAQSEQKELDRLNEIIKDDPVLNKMKISFDKRSKEKKEKLEKQIRNEKNSDNIMNKQLLERTRQLDRTKEDKARRNIFEARSISRSEREKRRMEDFALTTMSVRNEMDNSGNAGIPFSYSLEQNYPNPFNPVTTIAYSIPASGIVKIKIYDITGKEIVQLVNEVQETGRYEVQFDGSNLASGVYFYKIESGSFIETKRMVLLK